MELCVSQLRDKGARTRSNPLVIRAGAGSSLAGSIMITLERSRRTDVELLQRVSGAAEEAARASPKLK